MKVLKTTLVPAAVAALVTLSCAGTEPGTMRSVLLPSEGSPLVAFRLQFDVGSIHDPAGKEGLAALTGLMVAQAGTQQRSYAELVDALYPLAASINVDTDREVTVISGEVHRETLDEYTGYLTEVLLEPAFTESDFDRNKAQLDSFLKSTLRASNDELLGLETLQQVIFADHPYGHSPYGTVEGLESITLDDVREFYSKHYTQANLAIGVAGGYPDGYVRSLRASLSALPEGMRSAVELPQPAAIEGRHFTLVEKSASSVGIHLGYPLSINRADPDYYPLMVANSFLGEHRTFHGRLMQQLRGKRGLNYGDYSYIEYWHFPPFTTNPAPSVPRRQQYFSIWVRPVVPNTAHFALRNALYELERLIEQGMTEEEFELTRDFLVNYSKLWAQTLSNRLGFLMDSEFYGMEYYIDQIDERLTALTVEDVNAAIRRHLQSENFHGVLVTAGADEVAAYLEAGEPSPMAYNSQPEPQVLEDDKTIQQLEVRPTGFTVVPVEEVFQR